MAAQRTGMIAVPTYALYGDARDAFALEWLHCESIPERSARFDWEIGAHRHAHLFQIVLVSKGNGTLTLEREVVTLKPGSIVAIPPGFVHGFRFKPDVEGYVLTFLVEKLEPLLADGAALADMFVEPKICTLARAKPAHNAIVAGLQVLAEEFRNSAPGREAVIAAELTIILVALARMIAATHRDRDPQISTAVKYARTFQHLVDAHFRAERGLDFYADALGISPTHLGRVCHRAFRSTPLDMINRRIMLEASRDLAFTVLSIKEIAYSLGFDDPAYFTRFFTKNGGVTPTDFRKSHAIRRMRSAPKP